MRITIEVNNKSELEKISRLFKIFKINTVNITTADEHAADLIKGDKKIDPSELFGIWSKKPRSIENIRKTGWQKKSNVD